MGKPTVIEFPHAARIYGGETEIVAEVMTIRPEDATSWLRCNKSNRPLRKGHVHFLAQQMLANQWQVNGQAIVIADNEEVLDGQHRLFAIIEAGIPIKSLVVYGISAEAFKTMDTGAIRTGADALFLHYGDLPHLIVKALSTAAQWCSRLQRGAVRDSNNAHCRMSNTDIIEYCKEHPTLIGCAENLNAHSREARPMSLGVGTALYEMFARKHQAMADEFMNRFFSGEDLKATDPEYMLRQIFIRDAEKIAKLPMSIRVRMVIKGWNWRRRGNSVCQRQVLAITSKDEQRVRIF